MIYARHQFMIIILFAIVLVLMVASCTSSGVPPSESPDLTITSVSITLENARCYDGSSSLGTRVTVVNDGPGDAGSL